VGRIARLAANYDDENAPLTQTIRLSLAGTLASTKLEKGTLT
jgi:hypothetical protein